MVKQRAKENSTLNSWKEIATYLQRGVRTVQRWERESGLPVHRVRRTEHSPVFAYVRELEAWRNSNPALLPAGLAALRGQIREQGPDIHAAAQQTVQRSRHLIQEFGSLVGQQRSRAEALAHSLEAMLARIEARRKRGGK